jgi:AraC-like DNA-binding protein
MPNMELVAEHLCISSRTLRRQLKAEGVSYRELLDEVRMTLAEALLKIGGLSLEEIGIRLGYSEVSNFLHAFKRCKQQTPSQFRATLC